MLGSKDVGASLVDAQASVAARNEGDHKGRPYIPDGFKMTALGPLPEEWQVVELGALVQERREKNTKNVSLAVYTVSNVLGFVLSDEFFGKQVYSKDLKSYKIVSYGDFAYNPYRVNVGSIALCKNVQGGLVSPAYVVFRVKQGIGLDPDYLLALLKSYRWVGEIKRLSMSRGSVRRSLLFRDLSEIAVPLPPLPEQRAIAHVLSTIQRAVEAQGKVIAAARELKKSLMRHLFTYGPVPPAQAEQVQLKETEIGPVPERWEVVRLGEVAHVRGGKRLPKGHKFADLPTLYPYIRVVDFKDGSVDTSNLKFLTAEDHETIKRYTISVEDIYISIAGTIGLVGRVPPELDGANLTENAAKLVLKSKQVHQHFLVYFLSSERGQVQTQLHATKTSQPKLALARIQRILISLPPLPEQREIARILSAVDLKMEAEEKRKAALQALFKATLHHLMTGQVRVGEN